MEKLRLCFIRDEYVDFLRKYDNKVSYNKSGTRPYVGVVFEHNNFYYFAPLASPKPKHLNMNPKTIDIFKMDNGKLGIVNINNMIPTPQECISNVFSVISDEKYKILLENQLTYLNNHRWNLMKKIKFFYDKYKNGYLKDNIKARSCNFPLLEEKCLEYTEKELENV